MSSNESQVRPPRRRGLRMLVGIGGFVVLFLVLLSPAFGEQNASLRVYELSVGNNPDDVVTQFMSLTTGSFQTEYEGRLHIARGTTYQVVDQDSGSVYTRTGSRKYLGKLVEETEPMLAMRHFLDGDRRLLDRGVTITRGPNREGRVTLVASKGGRRLFTATIRRQLSDEEAQELQLFVLRPSTARNTEREVAVGAPSSLPIDAYWFGPTLDHRRASVAMERLRDRTPAEIAAGFPVRSETEVHITHYTAPGGGSSAEPGQDPPVDEVQVVNERLDSAHAQALIQAFNGVNGDLEYPAWPRYEIRLFNGEAATLVPHKFDEGDVVNGLSVITKSTLVTVSGQFVPATVPLLAARLRPLR